MMQIFKNKTSHVHRDRILRDRGDLPMDMMVDRMWAARDYEQGRQNIQQTALYLARRHFLESDPTADLSSVRAGFPFLGPEATPSKVIKELIKMYEAIRQGDYEVIENLDEDLEQEYMAYCDSCGWEGYRHELMDGQDPMNEHCPKCNSPDTWWGTPDEL